MKIAIIGGGIGGLTTAIALRQRGLNADVYEAAPEITAAGAGIMLPPNAMAVLGRLGVAEAVRAQGFVLEAGELRDTRDGLLQRFDLAGGNGRPDMTTLAIHRARLQRILVAQLPAAALHVGRRCAAIVEAADGALIRFTDGTEMLADIVIGADGLRSVAREMVRPGVPLRSAGQTAYRGVARMRLAEPMLRGGCELWGPGLRFGYGAIARDEVYWFGTFDVEAGEQDDSGRVRARVAALFADFPTPVPSLIAATGEAQIIRTDLFDFKPMRPWHCGRVVLIGDAAHASTPNLGQGGAQAIEDAWVLADQLSHGGDPTFAFEVYEELRAAKARYVVERSWQFGKVAHLSNPFVRRIRNGLMRFTPESVARKQMEWLFRLNY